MELNIKSHENYATLHYEYKLEGQGVRGQLIFPSQSFCVKMGLKINGTPIGPDHYDGLVEKLGLKLSASPLWHSLGYSPSLSISDTIELGLQCGIFVPLENDIRAFGTNANFVGEFSITLAYLTHSDQLELSTMLKDLEYLLCSWLVNVEYKFPLVLSYYARHFFVINYNHICKTVDEVFDPDLTVGLCHSEIPSKTQLLLIQLTKLHAKIMSEFNILNVLKELDASAYRRKVASEGKTCDRTPLKNTVYTIAFFIY